MGDRHDTGTRARANRERAIERVLAIFRGRGGAGDTTGNSPGSKWTAFNAIAEHLDYGRRYTTRTNQATCCSHEVAKASLPPQAGVVTSALDREQRLPRRPVRREAPTSDALAPGQPALLTFGTGMWEPARRVSQCADGREGDTARAAGVTGRHAAGEKQGEAA